MTMRKYNQTCFWKSDSLN